MNVWVNNNKKKKNQKNVLSPAACCSRHELLIHRTPNRTVPAQAHHHGDAQRDGLAWRRRFFRMPRHLRPDALHRLVQTLRTQRLLRQRHRWGLRQYHRGLSSYYHYYYYYCIDVYQQSSILFCNACARSSSSPTQEDTQHDSIITQLFKKKIWTIIHYSFIN